MTYDSLSLSEVIPASPERIYAAWLSSDEHTAFTGDKAVVEPFVGGTHSTFDGYAVGRTVELQPGRRIVQTWRAEDFPLGSPDSRVEITLEETVGGTMITILHTDIPSGQGSSYRDSWVKFYLEPMKGYFIAAKARAKTANGVRKHAPPAPVKAVAQLTKAKPKAKAKAVRRKPSKKAPTRAVAAKAKKSATKPAKKAAKKAAKKPIAKRVATRTTKKSKPVARPKATTRKKPARRR